MATTPDLLGILSDAGIERLRDGRKEIAGACPKHEERTGHVDHKPSWSINKFSYLHFCQSCHYKGTLTTLLVDMLGSAPVDLEVELKEQSFLRQMAEVRKDPTEVLDSVIPDLTDWTLRNVLRSVPDRLLRFRRLKRWAIDRYEVRWNHDTKQWVLPVRTPAGKLIGAQYRQKGNVLTLPKGMEKSVTLFGYSAMTQYDQVALVESPLDAVRLYGHGIPAVSSLGSWVSEDQVRLLARAFSTVYLALDDDKSGHQGMDFVAPYLRRHGSAVVYWNYTGLVDEDGNRAKDVGDASEKALMMSWYHTRRWGM